MSDTDKDQKPDLSSGIVHLELDVQTAKTLFAALLIALGADSGEENK